MLRKHHGGSSGFLVALRIQFLVALFCGVALLRFPVALSCCALLLHTLIASPCCSLDRKARPFLPKRNMGNRERACCCTRVKKRQREEATRRGSVKRQQKRGNRKEATEKRQQKRGSSRSAVVVCPEQSNSQPGSRNAFSLLQFSMPWFSVLCEKDTQERVCGVKC